MKFKTPLSTVDTTNLKNNSTLVSIPKRTILIHLIMALIDNSSKKYTLTKQSTNNHKKTSVTSLDRNLNRMISAAKRFQKISTKICTSKTSQLICINILQLSQYIVDNWKKIHDRELFCKMIHIIALVQLINSEISKMKKIFKATFVISTPTL